MQWLGRRESSNVEDRRGFSGGGLVAGGGIIGIIIYLLSTFLGGGNVDPSQLPQVSPQTQQTTITPD